MGLPFPEAEGGVGGGALELALAIEELARVDSSVAITVSANVGLAGAVLHRFGSNEQKERWLAPLARGESLGALAGAAPAPAPHPHDRHARPVLRAGQRSVTATKASTTSAAPPTPRSVGLPAVTSPAGEPREISMVLVPNGTPGYELGSPYHKLGWHASDTRE